MSPKRCSTLIVFQLFTKYIAKDIFGFVDNKWCVWEAFCRQIVEWNDLRVAYEWIIMIWSSMVCVCIGVGLVWNLERVEGENSNEWDDKWFHIRYIWVIIIGSCTGHSSFKKWMQIKFYTLCSISISKTFPYDDAEIQQ